MITMTEAQSRDLPAWAHEASFGIFVHWGPYSVPAWAEPTGALGIVPPEEWFAHNPYAEWYANTIRIEGSPAAAHHLAEYGGAPYEDFLDAWTADRYDPAEWARLFRAAGADYVIPVTKHHDGVTLWDAPGFRRSDHRRARTAARPDRPARRGGSRRGNQIRRLLLRRSRLGRHRLPPGGDDGAGRPVPAGGRRLRAIRHRARSRPHRSLSAVRDLERHQLARRRQSGRLARGAPALLPRGRPRRDRERSLGDGCR